MQPTENWYAKKTAFLVIHGNGPKREYETLDKFVSKFNKLLQNLEVDLEHRLDDKAQSYVHLKLKSSEYPYIDFYEYYWDRFMIRDITEKELEDFIKTVYEGLKKGKNYHIWDFIFNPRKGDTPIFLQLFRLPHWLARVLTRVNPISKWMIEYAKDVPIYCQNEQRSIYYQIRENVLSGAVKELTGLLNSDKNYGQIIIVGHSLGSVIAYDTLNRIARDLSSPRPPIDDKKDNQNPPLDENKVQKIKGLVTFGSFLDMVAFFFEAEKRAPRGNKLEQRIAYARHAFRKTFIPPGAGYKTNPINYSKLHNVKWLNFYHQHDFVANQRLSMYDLAQDLQIDMYELNKKDRKQRNTKASNADKLKWWEWLLFNIPGPGKWPGPKEWKKSMDAHNSYWEDDKMYEKIAEKFISEGFNTSSPSGTESKTHTGRLD